MLCLIKQNQTEENAPETTCAFPKLYAQIAQTESYRKTLNFLKKRSVINLIGRSAEPSNAGWWTDQNRGRAAQQENASKKREREGTSPLLAGGVPDLGLDDLVVDADAPGGELDADGGLGLEAELVAGEAGEEVGLADAGVADEHHLEQVVVVVLRPVRHRLAPRPPGPGRRRWRRRRRLRAPPGARARGRKREREEGRGKRNGARGARPSIWENRKCKRGGGKPCVVAEGPPGIAKRGGAVS